MRVPIDPAMVRNVAETNNGDLLMSYRGIKEMEIACMVKLDEIRGELARRSRLGMCPVKPRDLDLIDLGALEEAAKQQTTNANIIRTGEARY